MSGVRFRPRRKPIPDSVSRRRAISNVPRKPLVAFGAIHNDVIQARGRPDRRTDPPPSAAQHAVISLNHHRRFCDAASVCRRIIMSWRDCIIPVRRLSVSVPRLRFFLFCSARGQRGSFIQFVSLLGPNSTWLVASRHDSTRSMCRALAFWLCRTCRTARLEALDTTSSTRSIRSTCSTRVRLA